MDHARAPRHLGKSSVSPVSADVVEKENEPDGQDDFCRDKENALVFNESPVGQEISCNEADHCGQ